MRRRIDIADDGGLNDEAENRRLQQLRLGAVGEAGEERVARGLKLVRALIGNPVLRPVATGAEARHRLLDHGQRHHVVHAPSDGGDVRGILVAGGLDGDGVAAPACRRHRSTAGAAGFSAFSCVRTASSSSPPAASSAAISRELRRSPVFGLRRAQRFARARDRAEAPPALAALDTPASPPGGAIPRPA